MTTIQEILLKESQKIKVNMTVARKILGAEVITHFLNRLLTVNINKEIINKLKFETAR